MNDDLKFNPKLHEYSLKMGDGQYEVIPGVSEILQKAGITDFSMIDPWILKKAQDRGTEIHKITEEHDRGNVSIPDDYDHHRYYPYLQAWVDFLDDYQVEIKEIEIKTYSRNFLYAGTIDRVLVIEDQKGDKETCIVDIKCGGKWPSYPLQLAAYAYAYKEETKADEMLSRMCVYLKKDETYEVDIPCDTGDTEIFLTALRIIRKMGSEEDKLKLANWKENNV